MACLEQDTKMRGVDLIEKRNNISFSKIIIKL